MNAHQRAERLCREAEKEGLDAPTQDMISDAIHNAEQDIVTDFEHRLFEKLTAVRDRLNKMLEPDAPLTLQPEMELHDE